MPDEFTNARHSAQVTVLMSCARCFLGLPVYWRANVISPSLRVPLPTPRRKTVFLWGVGTATRRLCNSPLTDSDNQGTCVHSVLAELSVCRW